MNFRALALATAATLSLLLMQPMAFGQTAASPTKSDDWFQKPFLRVEQLPPGFYYLFKSGEMLPTFYIKVPSDQEKKRGEVAYIENRCQARKIDSQFKADSYEPHLSFKSLTPAEEKAAGEAAKNMPGEGTSEEAAKATEYSSKAPPPDKTKAPGPFKKNNYWSTFKALPKSANNALFGPTVKPNAPPFRFEETRPLIVPKDVESTPEETDEPEKPPKSAQPEISKPDDKESAELTKGNDLKTTKPATKSPQSSPSEQEREAPGKRRSSKQPAWIYGR